MPTICARVTFGTTECCRNSAINNLFNASSEDLSIEASVNNSGNGGYNSSVAFNSLPVTIYCAGNPVSYDHGASDSNQDSLVYSLINPLRGSTLPYTPISFNTNYTVNYPVRTSPPNTFLFNSETGEMRFVPAFQEQDVVAVKVDEYRNGVWMGSTMRDMQLVIMACNLSEPVIDTIVYVTGGYKTDSVTVHVCPGNQVQFDIRCAEPSNLSLTVGANLASLFGATFTQIGTGSNVTCRITWTPQQWDLGWNYFTVTARNNDCPLRGEETRSFAIYVDYGISIYASGTAYCGDSIWLSTWGGNTHLWQPSEGLSDTTSSFVFAAPLVPTLYTCSTDCGIDQIFIDVRPPLTINVGNDTMLCTSDSLQLHVTTNGSFSFFSYRWSAGGTGSVDFSNMFAQNPTAVVAGKATIYCRVSEFGGCSAFDSLQVEVGPYVNATAEVSAGFVCDSNPVVLTARLPFTVPLCEISATPCNQTASTLQVGSGTGLMPPVSPVSYPALYSNYRSGARTQIRYKKVDLLQMLGGSSAISGIGFEIAQLNSSSAVGNMEIRMGCMNTSPAFTSWQYNVSLVYSNISYVPQLGWNYHNFNLPYNWDGNSDLVIEICSYSATANTFNNKVRCSTASYQSMIYSSGSTTQCGFTGNPQFSSLLPNIKIGVCAESVIESNIIWSSVSQPNTVQDSVSYSPVVNPPATETYYFRVYDSVCSRFVTDSVTVRVNESDTIQQAAAICQGESYLFNGVNRTQAGVYAYTTQTSRDCPLVTVLNLSILPTSTTPLNVTVCNGTSFTFNGKILTTAGTYRDTLQNRLGCDSFIVLNLSTVPHLTGSLNVALCPGTPYPFNDQLLTATGVYKDTLLTLSGCDSIITLNLIINSVLTSQRSQAICQGDSFFFNGQSLMTVGIYKDTLVAQGGCDSVVSLHLLVNPLEHPPFSHAICQGDFFFFNGHSLTAAGVYKDTLLTFSGCDSIITLNLIVNSVLTSQSSQAICQGDSIFFNGQRLMLAGTYKDTLVAQGGCDSVVSLNLSVNPIVHSAFNQTICQGDLYFFNGQNLYAPGIYSDTLTAQNGCDSVITLTLVVNLLPMVTLTGISDTVCSNSPVIMFSGGQPVGGSYKVDGVASSSFDPSSGAGLYTITYIYSDLNNCIDSANQNITVVICSGLLDAEENSRVIIYPNPATDELNVQGNHVKEIRIYSNDGKLVKAVMQPSHNKVYIGEIASGIYQAEVKTGQTTIRVKWVKL